MQLSKSIIVGETQLFPKIQWEWPRCRKSNDFYFIWPFLKFSRPQTGF